MVTSFYWKKVWAYITCMLILIIILTSCQKDINKADPPTAIDGILDLAKWDFDVNGPVNLDGQ
ncbi:MAG: hypothetical protein WBI74_05285 [Caldicoprobacterales bacterium]